MKKFIVVLGVAAMGLFSVSAFAESFDDRVRLGKATEAAEAFKSYSSVMYGQAGGALQKAMVHCISTTPNPNMTFFVLVADLAQDGKASGVSVKPATNIAKCFAKAFAETTFPKPPVYPKRKGFPVVLEMQIKQ